MVPWSPSATTATDCTFHQIAPYIGRAKTSIAQYLIEEYTEVGDVVVDPFCGSGVIPLEAALRGRQVIAGDINPYGVVLSRAKLHAPKTEARALSSLERAWDRCLLRVSSQDLRRVPSWVRSFFHPETLRHALALRDELSARRNHFLMACLLGILHHQRPGFLSYPSSHLVPYLRSKLFPRETCPDLYEERDVFSRMAAKVKRTFRRPPTHLAPASVSLSDSRSLRCPTTVSAVVTSPPYMNELDYVRDNRLRLWFLHRGFPGIKDLRKRDREREFMALMQATLSRLASSIQEGGRIILVVGDASRGSRVVEGGELLKKLFREDEALAPFKLRRQIEDLVPDVRRSRRELRGTKKETVLVFQRTRGRRSSR